MMKILPRLLTMRTMVESSPFYIGISKHFLNH